MLPSSPAPSPQTAPPQASGTGFTWGRALALIGLIGLDQGSKALVEATIAFGQTIPILPSFNLVHVLNPGAAFSFLADAGGWQRYFFFVLAVAVSAYLLHGLRKDEGLSPVYATAAILISAGALGNAIDRVARGAVVDFLDVYYGPHHWPAFNLADSFIMIGVGLLLWFELRRGRRG